MAVAYDAVHAHEMVHVGVAYEDGIYRGVNPFCQMVHLAAIEEQGSSRRAYTDEQQRIVE